MVFQKSIEMTPRDQSIFCMMSIQAMDQKYKERLNGNINMGIECNDGKPSAYAHERKVAK